MKTFALLATASVVFATLLVAASPSQAQTTEQPLTREQVRAEWMRARASGELTRSIEGPFDFFSSQHPLDPKTRQQVITERNETLASGSLKAQTDETYGAARPSEATPSETTRARVRDEYVRARRAGETNVMDEEYGSQMLTMGMR